MQRILFLLVFMLVGCEQTHEYRVVSDSVVADSSCTVELQRIDVENAEVVTVSVQNRTYDRPQARNFYTCVRSRAGDRYIR